MDEHKKSYGLVCQSRPPYEVLYTRWLSYEDILLLKGVEEMVEIYYNSGQFVKTLPVLEEGLPDAFTLYTQGRQDMRFFWHLQKKQFQRGLRRSGSF